MKTLHSLNRLTLFMLLAFGAVAISLTYWSAFDAPSMLARSDNPRLVEGEEAIKRGAIYDRNEQVLAQNIPVQQLPSGWMLQQRIYPSLEAVSAVGYYSLVHGVGGAEAAFDKILRGDDLLDADRILQNSILHLPEVGSEVRLTLDLDLQKQIITALGNHRGAVVVLDVPSGAVLAMVSLPSYDPNKLADISDRDKLDAYYNALKADKTAPLLNRVTQGIYQPGGALETVILAAMLTNKNPLNGIVNGAMLPVQVNGMTLTCASNGQIVTLIDAYALACPAVFANAAVQNPEGIQAMIDAFGLTKAPILVSYETVSGKAPIPLNEFSDSVQRSAQGAGQGDLTVTPLQMVLVAATIANHGNAVTPYLGDALRRPDSSDWTPLPRVEKYPAVITPEVAGDIETAMASAIKTGGMFDSSPVKIFGHASIAYTGKTADSWFIGYTRPDQADNTADNRAVAVAVVIEDSQDSSFAAQVGGVALMAGATPIP